MKKIAKGIVALLGMVCSAQAVVTNSYTNVVITTNTSWSEAVYQIDRLTVSNGATLTVVGGSQLQVQQTLRVASNPH